MTRSGPRSLAELLQFGDISKLKAEAARRRSLMADVKAALPEGEAAHVVSANIDSEGRLIVAMDSAAWAARLHYLATELLGHRVRVKVAQPGAARGE
jgi:hypothetical protein